LECGSHLPLYVDEQRKPSANLESLPVWKPMDTQPLYRGYEPALIPVADHPVEPFRRNRKVTNLNQDLTLSQSVSINDVPESVSGIEADSREFNGAAWFGNAQCMGHACGNEDEIASLHRKALTRFGPDVLDQQEQFALLKVNELFFAIVVMVAAFGSLAQLDQRQVMDGAVVIVHLRQFPLPQQNAFQQRCVWTWRTIKDWQGQFSNFPRQMAGAAHSA
jgi:hypothetical protein